MNYSEDYYEILEVSPNSSDEIIKAAYRALVKKYHPDIYQGDKQYAEEMMQKINEAYHVLSNPTLHTDYDRKHFPEEEESDSSGNENEETAEDRIVCWNCGSSIPADSVFCTHCGMDIRLETFQSSKPAVGDDYRPEEGTEHRSYARKTSRFLYWLPLMVLGPFLIYAFLRAAVIKSQ